MKALAAGHWRLTLSSAMPLMQRLVEVLAGSLLSIDGTSHPDRHRILIDPTLFKTIFGIVCGYLIFIPVVWPGLDQRLPVVPYCIADSIAMFYDSTLVRNTVFIPYHMKEERWHMKYRLCLAERKYGFGAYRGRYGALHIGIDDTYGYDADPKELRVLASVRPLMRVHRLWLGRI